MWPKLFQNAMKNEQKVAEQFHQKFRIQVELKKKQVASYRSFFMYFWTVSFIRNFLISFLDALASLAFKLSVTQ